MKLCSGTWKNNMQWDFFLNNTRPPVHEIRAAAVVVFNSQDQVLLTYNIQRQQWEIPGGHIDLGETVEQAARRELFEEGGVTVEQLVYFGFRSVYLEDNNSIHSIYYVASTDSSPQIPLSAIECSDAQFFDVASLSISGKQDQIIKAALHRKNNAI